MLFACVGARVGAAASKLRLRSRSTRGPLRGVAARALQHAPSPQKVLRARDAFVRRHSGSTSTRKIAAEGSPSSRHICTAPQRESPTRDAFARRQREHFDTQDRRRGFADIKIHPHGAAARALRHAIFAGGSRRLTRIRTAKKRKCLHARSQQRVTLVLQRLRMSETLHLPRTS